MKFISRYLRYMRSQTHSFAHYLELEDSRLRGERIRRQLDHDHYLFSR